MSATRVLLLAPSQGLGGGIERYIATIEDSFEAEGISFQRMDLRTSDAKSTVADHRRIFSGGRRWIRREGVPTRIVVAHRTLLPVALAISKTVRNVDGLSVIVYGNDIWTSRRRAELHLLRASGVRVVAISSYSAGAVSRVANATILPPGLSRSWYGELNAAADRVSSSAATPTVLTSFRLSQWRDKGLPAIVEAVELMARDVQIKLCGSGSVPQDLSDYTADHPALTVVANLPDSGLADEMARADVFVLATRTRHGDNATGEGFGLVLLEAQLTGTATIAPAFGGSHEVFHERVTGLSPVDESPAALASVLSELFDDDALRLELASAGRALSRSRFEPGVYADLVLRRLL